jgi:hypothetical protein
LAIFSQLALSHVYELSLNKLPSGPLAFSCFKPHTGFNQYLFPRPRTMEDRRTVLACWYITSELVTSTMQSGAPSVPFNSLLVRIAFTLKKMEGLRWTTHLSDCLDYLDENPECPGDRLLAAQVRSQLVIDQICSDGPSATMPPYYQLSALTIPVEAVKEQIPPGLETNGESLTSLPASI